MPNHPHASPLSMRMSPVSFHVTPPGEAEHYTGHVTVTDSGTQPVTVHPAVMRLGAKSACTEHSVPWLSVNRATFKLAPGESRTLAFTVTYTPGLTGNAAVMAYGQGAPGSGVSAWAGVGARVVVGDGTQQCTKTPVTMVAHASGLPVGPTALAALPAALLIAGAVLAVRRRRRRTLG
jgi:hypothetical protein